MTDSKDRAVGLLARCLKRAGPENEVGDNLRRNELEKIVEAISDYTLERLSERARRRAEASDKLDEEIMNDIDPLGQG